MHHHYTIGQSGTGKSTRALHDAIDLIRRGCGVSFFDPHGQSAKLLLDHIPAERIQDTVYINPADPTFAVGYNPLQHGNHKIADDIASAFRHQHVDNWGPRLDYILRNTLYTLTFVPAADLLGVKRLLYDPEYREQCVRTVKDKDPILYDFWITEFAAFAASDRFEADIASPILNKIMPALTSPDLRAILCQSSLLNFREAMDNSRIIIANLSKGALGETYSRILGALLMSGLTQAALSREDIPEEKRVPHYLFVEEFQNFATPAFSVVLSEARKYQLFLTLIHQFLDQVPPELLAAVFGNISSIVAFRLGADDAPRIAKQIGLKNPDILIQLPNYRARETSLDTRGVPRDAHEVRISPLPPADDPRTSQIIAWTNSHASRRRLHVEWAIRKLIQQPEHNPVPDHRAKQWRRGRKRKP